LGVYSFYLQSSPGNELSTTRNNEIDIDFLEKKYYSVAEQLLPLSLEDKYLQRRLRAKEI